LVVGSEAETQTRGAVKGGDAKGSVEAGRRAATLPESGGETQESSRRSESTSVWLAANFRTVGAPGSLPRDTPILP